MASHQEACVKAQLQARGSLAGLRTSQSKAPVKRPRSNAGEQRRQLAQVRVSVAPAQSMDSLAMVSLERRLRGPLPVNREAEKNVDSPE
jgi:hypothetical protein